MGKGASMGAPAVLNSRYSSPPTFDRLGAAGGVGAGVGGAGAGASFAGGVGAAGAVVSQAPTKANEVTRVRRSRGAVARASRDLEQPVRPRLPGGGAQRVVVRREEDAARDQGVRARLVLGAHTLHLQRVGN